MLHQVSDNIRRLAGMFLVEQQRLAREVGISRQSMHAIYSGKSRPSTETAVRIAKAFGITVEDLFAEPPECLGAALPHLYEAPITELEVGETDIVTGKITPLRKGRK